MAYSAAQRKNIALAIGIYQVVGGVLGMGTLLLTALRFPGGFGPFLYLLLGFFLLYAVSVLAGFFIIIHRYRQGLFLTIPNQFLQLFSFAAGGFSFKYISGLAASLGMSLTDGCTLGARLEFSGFNFSYNSADAGLGIAVNVLPILVVYFAFKVLKENSSLSSQS